MREASFTISTTPSCITEQGAEDRSGQARFAAMMRVADLVVCGNQYLADEASRWTNRVTIVPTCIDVDAYHPRLRHNNANYITIGWTGSRSTNRYLNEILPILAKIHAPIAVKVISETMAEIDFSVLGNLPRTFVPWSPETEIVETATFDIGVMPVPENRFTQGKCGFKALQYMALGIPAVCSPVGVNRDIIHDGADGFLPRSRDDWFQTIARLAKDRFLRETIGHAGRRRVEGAFSTAIHGPHLVKAVEKARSASASRPDRSIRQRLSGTQRLPGPPPKTVSKAVPRGPETQPFCFPRRCNRGIRHRHGLQRQHYILADRV